MSGNKHYDDDCWGIYSRTLEKAAEFSFLLGLLTLSAAAGYKILTKWEVMEAHLSVVQFLLGV